jgi:hypothetical protein
MRPVARMLAARLHGIRRHLESGRYAIRHSGANKTRTEASSPAYKQWKGGRASPTLRRIAGGSFQHACEGVQEQCTWRVCRTDLAARYRRRRRKSASKSREDGDRCGCALWGDVTEADSEQRGLIATFHPELSCSRFFISCRPRLGLVRALTANRPFPRRDSLPTLPAVPATHKLAAPSSTGIDDAEAIAATVTTEQALLVRARFLGVVSHVR